MFRRFEWSWQMLKYGMTLKSESDPGRQKDAPGSNGQDVQYPRHITPDPFELCISSLQRLLQSLPLSSASNVSQLRISFHLILGYIHFFQFSSTIERAKDTLQSACDVSNATSVISLSSSLSREVCIDP
jgi:hypothetical protein